jgi:hypothetical protein
VLCDYANITNDGKVNILGIFAEINPPILPWQLPQAFLVVTFSASPAEQGQQRHLRLQLLRADGGTPLISIENDVTVPPPPRPGVRASINLMIGMGGLIFPQIGDYAFSVLVDNDEKASIPVRVNPPRTIIPPGANPWLGGVPPQAPQEGEPGP